jgi:hypothetical protein
MIPIGDPLDGDAWQSGDSAGGRDGDGPGQASPAPARPACRPVIARREGPPRR